MMRPTEDVDEYNYGASRRASDIRRDEQRARDEARITDLVHAVLVVALMIFIVVFAGSYSR